MAIQVKSVQQKDFKCVKSRWFIKGFITLMNTGEQEDRANNAFMTMAKYSSGSVRISLQKHFFWKRQLKLCVTV